MKKLNLLIAAVMLIGCGLVMAESVRVPGGLIGNPLQTDDYGGVDIATSGFSSGVTAACQDCRGVVSGIYVSSDIANSYIDVFDSTTSMITPADDKLMFRVYTGTTTGTGPGGQFGTWNWFNHPVRFYKGLAFKASVTTLNKVALFYWKRQ